MEKYITAFRFTRGGSLFCYTHPMSALSQNVILFLAVSGVLLYYPLNRIHAPGRWFFHDTIFDRYIPLIPYFVIPYVALFPYMVATVFFVAPTTHALQLFATTAIAAWSAAFVWYFAPAGILRKREIGPDFFSRMIIWIYEHDSENNTFPSSHVFYAIICTYFLVLAFPAYAIIFIVIGTLIAVSTVLVKQHHAADILGGIVWAIASIFLANFLVG